MSFKYDKAFVRHPLSLLISSNLPTSRFQMSKFFVHNHEDSRLSGRYPFKRKLSRIVVPSGREASKYLNGTRCPIMFESSSIFLTVDTLFGFAFRNSFNIEQAHSFPASETLKEWAWVLTLSIRSFHRVLLSMFIAVSTCSSSGKE